MVSDAHFVCCTRCFVLPFGDENGFASATVPATATEVSSQHERSNRGSLPGRDGFDGRYPALVSPGCLLQPRVLPSLSRPT